MMFACGMRTTTGISTARIKWHFYFIGGGMIKKKTPDGM